MDVPMIINPELAAEALSVRKEPSVTSGAARIFYTSYRGPILPGRGTREREWKLRQYDHHDYNAVFKGAKGALIKRIQSTPWVIVAQDADRWQRALMRNWEDLLAGVVSDFLRHDSGAWIEIIAPGDPKFAPIGPMVGLNVLDSLRIYPTGNSTYPSIYYDLYGKLHLLHKSRIVQMVDSAESEEGIAGYGECALSRAIAAVKRDILMNRYIEQFLDDKPPPGITVFGNLGNEEVEAAIQRMERELSTDELGVWGRTIRLYGLQAEMKPTVEHFTYQKPPEKFDYIQYKSEIVNEVALATGMDKLDLWELTSGALGTGTQSEIMAQKSRGKAVGVILKRLERVINQALPDSAEFRWEYKDPQEDKEEAEKAASWTVVVQNALASGSITPDEGRLILANQIPAFKDALIDAEGNIRRLPDDDPKGPDEPQLAQDTDGGLPSVVDTLAEHLGVSAAPAPGSPVEQMAAHFGFKAFGGTARDFSRYFSSFVRVGQAHSFSPAIMRATFREELVQAGTAAYEDGLRDGGADPTEADAVERAERRRKVAEWLAIQNSYINSLVDEIDRGTVTREQAGDRAALWVNKALRSIYLAGLHDADSAQLYTWQLGQTEEHCETCLRLNGQTHSMKEWMQSGFLPGAQILACKGFNCDCALNKALGPARGRLPNAGAFAGLTDRFSGFFQRLAGRKSLEISADPDEWARFLMRRAA